MNPACGWGLMQATVRQRKVLIVWNFGTDTPAAEAMDTPGEQACGTLHGMSPRVPPQGTIAHEY
jgi:hypothetical protein